MGPAFAAGLEVGRFHGIGPATEARMNRLGIHTGADLRDKSLDFLTRHFGVMGERFYGISRGIDHRSVRPDRERKSVGAETTFFDDLSDYDRATEELKPLIGKVWRHCEANGLHGRTVTLKVKYSDFKIITRSRTGGTVGSIGQLQEMSLGLLAGVFPAAKGIRLLGVTVSGFDGEEGVGEAVEQLQLAI